MLGRITRPTLLALSVVVVAVLTFRLVSAGDRAAILPDPQVDASLTSSGETTAVVAGGCFWGIQAVFQHVNGVTRAISGYSGGAAATAHYEGVGSGPSGDAEHGRAAGRESRSAPGERDR